MDDRYVFDRFHEALELEPNEGAYERFRSTFINLPDATKKRPVFRLRFSKMGFRLAAAIAVVAIAIGVAAAVLATHHPTAGIPASPHIDQNTKDYQALMTRDYDAMNRSTSNHCNTIADSGCAAAIAPVNATLQQWINDLAAYRTPAAYVALDSMIRRHLRTVIVVQEAAIQYQKAGNAAAFTLAMYAAFYERSWIDPATFTVQGQYTRVAVSYRAALQLAEQSLTSCIGNTPGPAERGCNELLYAPCANVLFATCEGYIEGTLTQLETYVIAVVQNPASAKLAAKDQTYQSDLAKTDDALLSITEAMVAGDPSKTATAQSTFTLDLQSTKGDVDDLLIS